MKLGPLSLSSLMPFPPFPPLAAAVIAQCPLQRRLGAALALATLLVLAAPAPAQAYQFRIGSPTFSDTTHLAVDIDLNLMAGDAIESIQFDFGFNSAALIFLDAQAGALVTAWPIFDTSAAASSPVTVLAADLVDTPGPGGGRIARLAFEVQGPGAFNFGLANIELGRDSGLIDSGLISVVPEPASTSLMLGGLLALSTWRRRTLASLSRQRAVTAACSRR